MRGEFLPVTIDPFFSSMAAPQKIPLCPFFAAFASRAACFAGFTTLLCSGWTFNFFIRSSTLWTVSLSTNPMTYSQEYLKYLLITSCLAASWTALSSLIPELARLTPISVGDLYMDSAPVSFSRILFNTGKISTSRL
ncbi:hypothetical protein ES703_43483 [subsurface metagenome]